MKSTPSTPTPEELRKRILQAKSKLLEASSQRRHWQGIEAMLKERIKRLEQQQ